MTKALRTAMIAALGTVAAVGCDSVLENEDPPAGLQFTYSGATAGNFTSAGTVSAPDEGLPELESFAMAQRDSIDGLLLGSFRRTGEGRGDLFILQIRGTQPASYTCGGVSGGPACYGHLYIGVEIGSSTVSAQEIYGISAGEVVLNEVTAARVQGSFTLTLQGLEDPSATLTTGDGSIDVPLVEGVFNSSFACLAKRLQEGPEAPCD